MLFCGTEEAMFAFRASWHNSGIDEMPAFIVTVKNTFLGSVDLLCFLCINTHPFYLISSYVHGIFISK
jgi:hypothetical protein